MLLIIRMIKNDRPNMSGIYWKKVKKPQIEKASKFFTDEYFASYDGEKMGFKEFVDNLEKLSPKGITKDLRDRGYQLI